MNKGGFDSNATGARALLSHSIPFSPAGSRLAGRRGGGQGVGLSPPHPAGGQGGLCARRASPLRAPPAELQFDISRPARARLESEHVPGCFIAAAAAAGPRGSCQRLGCCLAKSYPGRVIERALSKYTRGGFLSSPRTCPAPVLGASPHISPDHSLFRLREKNEAQERRDVAAASSLQLGVSRDTFDIPGILCLHVCLWVPPGDTTPEQEGSWRSLSLWPLFCSGRKRLVGW
ncbi:hypothetical protein A6R68_22692 [Neotoma lepida]|uniref:Uncharacterized protein n=1 Tax=Neotoma lepida TaxID=56216 RepID=A0A1A6I028_NEOLE|nr:hypothetical protein A6R68_22692 [Neotoma lepida]